MNYDMFQPENWLQVLSLVCAAGFVLIVGVSLALA